MPRLGLIGGASVEGVSRRAGARRARRPVTASGKGLVVESIRRAYADASPQGKAGFNPDERNLSFLAAPIPVSEAYETAKFIGGYNRFSPKRATDKLVEADPLAHVMIGREGSVVFYIKPSAPAGAARLYDSFEKYGDEVGFVSATPSETIGEPVFKPGMFLRVWWD